MSSVANRIWWPGRIGRAQNCAISKRRLMELEHLQAAQISLSPFQSTKSVCQCLLAVAVVVFIFSPLVVKNLKRVNSKWNTANRIIVQEEKEGNGCFFSISSAELEAPCVLPLTQRAVFIFFSFSPFLRFPLSTSLVLFNPLFYIILLFVTSVFFVLFFVTSVFFILLFLIVP